MKIAEPECVKDVLEVGKWQFSADYGIVASPHGKSLVLEPRLSKLMFFLSMNVNSAVSRNYLVEHIWADVIVNEESLTRAIADLRKTLSIHFDNSVKIETIRKRGYKLSLQPGPKVYAIKARIRPRSGLIILGSLLLLLLIWLVAF